MQHYTRNKVEASAWCRKCAGETTHRVDGVKLGPCLVCLGVLSHAAGSVYGGCLQIERKGDDGPLTQGELWGDEL